MHDPLRPHHHHNNRQAPDDDSRLWLHYAGETRTIDVEQLRSFPSHRQSYRYVTDHGKRGPLQLEGVKLITLIVSLAGEDNWQEIEVLSADGFGNRIDRGELMRPLDPIMLCYAQDGQPLSRQEGLVRLLVPSETENALRQVKWVRDIRIVSTRVSAQS